MLPAQVQNLTKAATGKMSRRNEAAANGLIFVNRFAAFGRCFAFGFDSSTAQGMPLVSASRIALPNRSNSLPVRNRSRRFYLNLAMARAGFGPSAIMPARPAMGYILRSAANPPFGGDRLPQTQAGRVALLLRA